MVFGVLAFDFLGEPVYEVSFKEERGERTINLYGTIEQLQFMLLKDGAQLLAYEWILNDYSRGSILRTFP